MNDEAIVLYGEPYWVSPYVYSCFVALREKHLPFQEEIVALANREQHAPAFRDRSLTSRVPALVHGDFWLAESSAIVEYLEETFPQTPRVLPIDVRERARARQIMAWIRSDLLPLREQRSTHSIFYPLDLPPLTAEGQAAADKLLRAADLVIRDGATQLFAQWSIADADLAMALHRLIANGHEVPAKVRRYAAAQWERPSIHAWVTHARPAQYVP